MATGIPFPEANTILRAPTPEDAAAGTVYNLHVHRYRDLDGRPNVISKWQFTPEELAMVVAAGGVFWFHSWGDTHPPISIEGANPFVRVGEQGASDPAIRENDKIAAALKPFADCVAQIGVDEPDDEWAKFRLLVGDYRRAHAALAAIPGGVE